MDNKIEIARNLKGSDYKSVLKTRAYRKGRNIVGTHPVIKEVMGLLREDRKFRKELAKALLIQLEMSEAEEQTEILRMISDLLPESIKKMLRPGELCEHCSVRY